MKIIREEAETNRPAEMEDSTVYDKLIVDLP